MNPWLFLSSRPRSFPLPYIYRRTIYSHFPLPTNPNDAAPLAPCQHPLKCLYFFLVMYFWTFSWTCLTVILHSTCKESLNWRGCPSSAFGSKYCINWMIIKPLEFMQDERSHVMLPESKKKTFTQELQVLLSEIRGWIHTTCSSVRELGQQQLEYLESITVIPDFSHQGRQTQRRKVRLWEDQHLMLNTCILKEKGSLANIR